MKVQIVFKCFLKKFDSIYYLVIIEIELTFFFKLFSILVLIFFKNVDEIIGIKLIFSDNLKKGICELLTLINHKFMC